MIIVKLSGGIGNQMFQYAFGRHIATKRQAKLLLDLSFFDSQDLRTYGLNIFDVKASLVSPILLSILFPNINSSFFIKSLNKMSQIIFNFVFLRERSFKFYSEAMHTSSNTYIDGYWQSEKYFLEIEDIIRKDFSFKYPMDPQNDEMSKLILGSNSVSIHVRRGDYVSNVNTNKVHGTCDLNYYQRAIEYINSRIDDPIYFFFSDDMEWVRENIKIDNECYFIDFNKSDRAAEDMRLMSLCKNNIIANSSFSWWGAWLNVNHDKIVIAPKVWFNDSSFDTSDLIPKAWLKI